MDGMVWLCDIAVAKGGTHHFAKLVQILNQWLALLGP
jgi:hypothetical protein